MRTPLDNACLKMPAMDRIIWRYVCGLFGLVLLGCSSEPNYAPVVDGWVVPAQSTTQYTVRRGDTLYAIAWRFEQDYRDLARWNHLKPPFQLQRGEVLHVKAPKRVAHKLNRSRKKRTKPAPVLSYKRVTNKAGKIAWRWPAKGNIIQGFTQKSGGNKGIDIGGSRGETVRAAADGQVAYAGNGLKGYGNLLIIKHTSAYFSAYAHNETLFVKEGAWVKAGQHIARMGKIGVKRVQLHFEIRRGGKPVDPLYYLPKRKA